MKNNKLKKTLSLVIEPIALGLLALLFIIPTITVMNLKPEVYGYTDLPTHSDISLIINDQIYRIQNPEGNTITQRILLEPNQKYIVYLAIENFSNVKFNEDFTLEIKEIE